MATGNDVREIFQLKPTEQVRRVQKTEKKPGTTTMQQSAHIQMHPPAFPLDGISRELYGLIGNNVSTVAFNNPTYKPKLAKGKKAVNWTWRPFMNPSRDDDLTLHHWEKTRTDPNEEYRFYKFHKAINLIDFTETDYTTHLQDSDWSYDETKYLWDLCRRFDLRWVVIQDRYEWPAQEQDRMALQCYNGNSIAPKTIITPSSTDTITENNSTNTTATPSTTTTTASTTQATIEPKPLDALAETLPTPVTLTQPDVVAAVEPAPVATTAPETAMDVDAATASATTTTTLPATAPAAAPASASAEVVSHDNKAVPATEPSGTTTTTTAAAAAGAAASTATSSDMEIVPFTPPKMRSMEDLKSRYYSINRILTKVRMTDSSQASEKAQLLASMAYDKNREIERKKNLEILNTRTPEQIEEEEALYLEARRIDQNEKKITRERENLLRLLNTRDIYGPGGPASAGLAGQVAGGPGTGIIIPSNSITIPSSSSSSGPSGANANGPMSPIGKNANGTASSSAAAAAAAAAGGAAVKKRKKAPKGSVQADDHHTLSGSGSGAAAGSASASSSTKGSANHRRPSNSSSTNDLLAAATTLPPLKKEKLIPGAYLRSQKTAPVVSTKQQRVQSTLVQLGLPFKPAMPTATVIAKWDQLSNNIVTLLDLKKQVDKLESDLKVVKMRRGSGSSGSGLLPGSAGASAAGAGTGASSAGSTADGNFGVKREGIADDSGASGQVKKKKKKE
ncbi:swr complex subunit [Mortierella alpina]|nr:swr complex subunit [Mortierella alpina]